MEEPETLKIDIKTVVISSSELYFNNIMIKLVFQKI